MEWELFPDNLKGFIKTLTVAYSEVATGKAADIMVQDYEQITESKTRLYHLIWRKKGKPIDQ